MIIIINKNNHKNINEDEKNRLVFNVNQRFTIILPSKEHENLFSHYSSRIEDIKYDQMELMTPTDKSVPIFLSNGDKFEGRMVVDTAVYGFSCTYIKKFVQDNILMWAVSLPFDIHKIQLRNYFRYEINLPIKVKKSSKNQADLIECFEYDEDDDLKTLKTKDISAGGVKIINNMTYLSGEVLKLAFDIPEYGTIITFGKVLRVDRPNPDIKLFHVAVQFFNITEKERNAISQFIFRKQLEDRYKKTDKR